MYYLNYFFSFSILGHILETFFYSNGESGILLLNWTPVYGIGTIIILIIHKFIKQIKLSNFFKALILFILSAIILSIIEAIGGYLIKWIFNTELWNYSNYKYNIGNYTALEMSLIWGIASILLIYLIKPIADKIINKIPKFITYILTITFISDLIITLITKA